jgi:predicted RNA methylase
MSNSKFFVTRVNELLSSLEDSPTLDKGIEIADEFIRLFTDSISVSSEDIFESSLELPNAERYDSWFQPHPIFKSNRACFELSETPLLQAKFYWLKKKSRQIIAGSVHFTPNYEDEDYTQNDRYKVGLDFFLSPNGKSLQIVLSNRGNLRIVEINKRLNNTQVEIFKTWTDVSNLKTREALHNTLWDSFQLKSVNQKFYLGISNSFTELLQHLKSIEKDEEEAKLFASRLLGRLLFCWFLRKKGIIDESIGYFDAQLLDATTYYKQSLERLFFLTLNTSIVEREELTKQHLSTLLPNLFEDHELRLFKKDLKTPYLNGGLFEPNEKDWYKDGSLTFPEGYFANLYRHFEEFNFTTDESSPEYEQIAIDPEMLGRVFESLLATQVDETGKKATKAKGAFYTPREIVSYMCKESIRTYLKNTIKDEPNIEESIDSLMDISDSVWAKSKSNTFRDKVKANHKQILEALDKVKILDPACGSGAFPMGVLHLMLRTYERLERPFDSYKTKLNVIQNNIFGVDIEPMAVEISRLRVWLSLIVDEKDALEVEPLPNLDFKFVCANSLMPLEGDKERSLSSDSDLHEKLKSLRVRYFNTRMPERKKKLQADYYNLINKTTLLDDLRTKQLQSFNPFINRHPAKFFDADQMFGITEGFDVVIGNPPYGAKLSVADKKKFRTFYKSAKTITGKQKGSVDTYSLFMDMGLYHAIKRKGVLNYIVPLAFTSSESMSALHGMILKDCGVIKVSSYSNRPKKIFDSADQRVSIVLLNRDGEETTKLLTTGVLKRYSTTSVRDIIDNLRFVNSINHKTPGRFAKVGHEIEIGILEKLELHQQLKEKVTSKNHNPVYYRTSGGRYYHIVTTYPTGSSKEKPLYIKKEVDARIIAAVLSSNLYFWLSQAYSNNLDLNVFEILMCPIPEMDKRTQDELGELFDQYQNDLEKNAKIKKAKYSTATEHKEYKARLSKARIDKLDLVLQKPLGLSDEQTDYLINFEIEFRTDNE